MLKKLGQNGCSCLVSPEERSQARQNKIIDRELSIAKRRLRTTQKIVLLGAGESGKSTFLKQIQIIHGSGFDEKAKIEYRTQIYENIINGLSGLANGKNDLKIAWYNNDSIKKCQQFVYYYIKFMNEREKKEKVLDKKIEIDSRDFAQVSPIIQDLWLEPGMQMAFERRREFPFFFVENLSYFMGNFERISQASYIPNADDILRCRRATTGINEIEIMIRNVPFVFVDVGGQRTQRQKWQQCFVDVTAILFLVSTSEYDEYLREDLLVNRFEESCRVFETLINYSYLKTVTFILFLNKHDLMKEKIKRSNIKNYCNDFRGDPQSLSDVERYFKQKFYGLRHRKTSRTREEQVNGDGTTTDIYSHFTTAIDTNNIKTIFESVRSMILERNCQAILLQ